MILLFIVAIVIVIIFICRDTSQNGADIPPGQISGDYKELYNRNPEQPGQAAPQRNAAMDYTNRYPAPGQPGIQAPLPQYAAYAVPPVKKPFSPIPMLLIAGVVFLFLGGIIFLTSTWEMLPDFARAGALLSASVVAFTVNILAEKKLRLPKTGLAFYVLGCIFLPLALGGIGVFELMGNWFSFHGEGCMLLAALICFCVAATSLLGQSNYKSTFLAWMGLSGMSGMWLFLSVFLTTQILPASAAVRMTVFDALLLVYAAATTLLAELYLRSCKGAPTPLSKAMLPYLYMQNMLYAIPLLPTAAETPAAAAVIGALMATLFLTKRFASGSFHGGIFGFCFCMLTALASAAMSDTFAEVSGFSKFNFTIAGMTFILLNIAFSAKSRPAYSGTFTVTGLIFGVPAAILCLCQALHGRDFLFLYVPLVIAAVHFAITKKRPISANSYLFCLFAMMLYSIGFSCAEENNMLYMLLLIVAALLLLIQFFLSKRLWPLMLSICTCAGLLLMQLPYGFVSLSWLCAAAMLGGLVYAHIAGRPLLERCCEWAGIPFLLIACVRTFAIGLTNNQAWLLAFAVLALVFLMELTVCYHHGRSKEMRGFCMNLSIWLGLVIFISTRFDGLTIGWQLLLALILLVFTAGNLKRSINAAAVPMLIFLFAGMNDLVEGLGIHLTGYLLIGTQVACYVAMLLLFCLLGRLLIPESFCVTGTGRFQLDWALLAGVLPVFGAALTLNWEPAIVTCLLLSVYSLLYIGRVKEHYVPALLASMFGCLAIFFHNILDPFALLEIWKDNDIKTAQILLYLLPMHLFILSLVPILPKKFRSAVHGVRFCMYCFTTVCLLAASLNFGRVEDALIVSVFSFAIFAASFIVKRLRWFTLGFSVLILITVRMTWHFWTSLHWGIYLFLVGILLIGIAFYYEYAIRRTTANPGEPKKKIRLFKEWKW